VLVVNGLVKRFGGFTAVNNVSFKVEKGEILGLIGPNGSGKSTIFNMLSGTFPPSAGSISFEGRELSGLAPHRIINAGVGRTFQIPRPFRRLSIFENVALAGYYGQGSHSAAKANEAAERALAMVGLPTDRAASVDGLGAAGLKKLELAKALATSPKLLLADESLGGLDESEMDQAADMLRKIRDERFTNFRIDGNVVRRERQVRRFEFLPHDQLVTLIRGARALLFPSIYEGFGLPVIEAMALGTPVLTSNASSLPEIAGNSALVVDPYSVDDIMRGIIAIEADADLRHELQQRGRVQARRFTPSAYESHLSKLYERLS